jgi:hypothetical protein
LGGVFSLEESFGDTGLISDNGIDHSDFLTISGFDILDVGGNDFNVNVISASSSFKIFNLNECGFTEFLI